MSYRKATESEERLLRRLIEVVPELGVDDAWFSSLLVEPMDDGGMGSLRFLIHETTSLSYPVAELMFTDADGVPVDAAFYVDDAGTPAELGLWKVDFEPLIAIPDDLPEARLPSDEAW